MKFIDWDALEDCLQISRLLLDVGAAEPGDKEEAFVRQATRYPSLDPKKLLDFSVLFTQPDDVQNRALVLSVERYFPWLVYEGDDIKAPVVPVAWSIIRAASDKAVMNRLTNDPDEMFEAEGFDGKHHVRTWISFPIGCPYIPVIAKWGALDACRLTVPEAILNQLTGQIIGDPLHVQFLGRLCLVIQIEIYLTSGELRPYATAIQEVDKILEVWLIESRYFDLTS